MKKAFIIDVLLSQDYNEETAKSYVSKYEQYGSSGDAVTDVIIEAMENNRDERGFVIFQDACSEIDYAISQLKKAYKYLK